MINISNCSNGNFQYMASPNPASNMLNISQTNQSSFLNMSSGSFASEESNSEVLSSATLFDFNGNPVQTISPAIGLMNVKSLSPGHYILVVTYGESSESHHILVE